MPKILITDKSGLFAAQVKQLFSKNKIKIFESSAKSRDPWIVISSDLKLLEKFKRHQPNIIRVLLIEAIQQDRLIEAINEVQIFRVIHLPKSDPIVRQVMDQVIAQALYEQKKQSLVHDINDQNEQLEELTRSMESEIFRRTKGIEDSRRKAENKQKKVRELTSFVKNLSRASEMAQIFQQLQYEWGTFAPNVHVALFMQREKEVATLHWTQSGVLHDSELRQWPTFLHAQRPLTVKASADHEWWGRVFNRNCRSLVIRPLLSQKGLSQSRSVLIIEHGFVGKRQKDFLEKVDDRLNAFSVVLEKMIFREELLDTTRQWEAVFNGFRDPVAILDSDFHVFRANKNFYRNLTLVSSTQKCFELLDQRRQPCAGCPLPLASDQMTPTTGMIRTGARQSFKVYSYPVLHRPGRRVHHYNDISVERELYTKLIQSEKLAAVGLLAGNMAHELNNPLSGIKAYAQLLKSEFSGDISHVQDLDEIERAAVRCQQIIKNLLNFSVNPETGEQAQLNDLVMNTLPLLKVALRSQRVETHFTELLPSVKVPTSQVQQVIFNLISNACQAMGEGGVLTLKTWHEGAFVCLSVSDTGPGIPEEIQNRVFEPFFTTKSLGVGTGLGLSISRNLVEKLGGRLSLYSQKGQGTTFIMALPVPMASRALP